MLFGCRLVYANGDLNKYAPKLMYEVDHTDVRPFEFCREAATFMLEVLRGPQHGASSSQIDDMAQKLGRR